MAWGRPWKAWGGADDVADQLDALEAELDVRGLFYERDVDYWGSPGIQILMEKEGRRQAIRFSIRYVADTGTWTVRDDWRRGASLYKTFKGARTRLLKAIDHFGQTHRFLRRGGHAYR